jgi:hypothetical protein
MIAAAVAWAKLPMSCAVCRVEGAAAQRELWGCDQPATAPTIDVPCWECWGLSDQCRGCGGAGTVDIFRCPYAIVQPGAQMVVNAVSWFMHHGLMPVAGGTQDQAVTFHEAVRIVSRAFIHFTEKPKKGKRGD